MHATLCENWAVYHFWSLAHHRFEMAVIELYDATPRDLSIASVLLGSSNVTLSAFSPPPIEARLMLLPSSHAALCCPRWRSQLGWGTQLAGACRC